MRINVYFNPSIKHHAEWGALFYEGLEKHGLKPNHVAHYGYEPSDLSIVWSFHKKVAIQGAENYLILERGYMDRYNNCSVSLNGLHNLSEDYTHNIKDIKGGFKIAPKKYNKGAICVIGQVPGDASLWDTNIKEWAYKRCAELSAIHENVIFKPHPLDKTEYVNFPCEVVDCPLEDLYDDVRLFITFSSTAGIDAVINGCKATCEHQGSMLYKYMPEIENEWLSWLSHRQWSRKELKNGDFWDYFNEYFKNR